MKNFFFLTFISVCQAIFLRSNNSISVFEIEQIPVPIINITIPDVIPQINITVPYFNVSNCWYNRDNTDIIVCNQTFHYFVILLTIVIK